MLCVRRVVLLVCVNVVFARTNSRATSLVYVTFFNALFLFLHILLL